MTAKKKFWGQERKHVLQERIKQGKIKLIDLSYSDRILVQQDYNQNKRDGYGEQRVMHWGGK